MNMKIENILAYLKSLSSSIPALFRNVRNSPYAIFYLFLSLFLIVLFTIVTFPFDHLIRKKLSELEGKSFRIISVDQIDVNFLRPSNVKKLELVLLDGTEINTKNVILNLSLNPYRLFISHRILSDVQVDDFFYKSNSNTISLNLNGNVDLILDPKNNIPTNGDVKLIFSEVKIKPDKISIPGPMGNIDLNIELITIPNGVFSMDIINSTARIKDFKLTGPELNCTITGSIAMVSPIERSNLNLTLIIDPESSILENYRDLVKMMTKNNPLTLTLTGTIDRPKLQLAGVEKTNEN